VMTSAHVFVGEIETDLDATSGKGIVAYQCALEIWPDDAYVWLTLGEAHVRSGSCALALEPCEVYPLEAGRWAYQSATLRENAPFGSDQTLIDLEKAASAHLNALDAK
jgi:hypothetical protein